MDTDNPAPPWRRKYVDFWWNNRLWKDVAATYGRGFVNAYFIYRKAIEGIKIPKYLGAFDNIYMKDYMESRGWAVKAIQVNGMHFYDFPDEKAAWLGAGERVFKGITPLPRILAQKVFPALFKAVPPAIAHNDAKIIMSNARYWIKFLRGWLHPEKYLVMKR